MNCRLSNLYHHFSEGRSLILKATPNLITLCDLSQLSAFLVKNLHTRSYQMATFRSAGLLIWLWGWGGGQGDRTPINRFLNTVRDYYFFCITRNPVSRSPGLVQLVQRFLSGGKRHFPREFCYTSLDRTVSPGYSKPSHRKTGNSTDLCGGNRQDRRRS